MLFPLSSSTMNMTFASIAVLFASFCMIDAVKNDSIWISIETPDVVISQKEVALCKAFPLPDNGSFDVVEFVPEPMPDFENHMNVYLCQEPAVVATKGEDYVWNCFGDDYNDVPGHQKGTICKDGVETGLFVTFDNREDSSLKLPDDVAYKAGARYGFKYIVMATHYPHLGEDGPARTGHSVMNIRMIPDPDATSKRNKASGFSLLTWGFAPAGSPNASITASYVYDQGLPMHPIAFLAHTHHMATDFELWRTSAGTNETVLMWKQNPTKDVRFHILPVQPPIRDGDKLTLHCTYNTTSRKEILRIQVEEMCGAILMYAVEGHELIPRQSIVTIAKEEKDLFPKGPEPNWWWNYY